MNNLTDEQIEAGIMQYSGSRAITIETKTHYDRIRISYEWLDAQLVIKRINRKVCVDKHLIERWTGRHMMPFHISVAAIMHRRIRGEYPFFNISSRLTNPLTERLSNIEEGLMHMNYRVDHEAHSLRRYRINE